MSALLRPLGILVLSSAAAAQTLVPGPGEGDYDAALAAKADGLDRQIHGLLTVPLGFGLEAFISSPANRAHVETFIASGSRDFKAATGKHPYEVIDSYNEHGDLGMFGGVQAAGDAFRYAVLRDSGAPPAEVEVARRALLRAMDGMHWNVLVTGEPGVVARGIRRITPEPGEPALPGQLPALVPMFDSSGAPLPAHKVDTWRAERSGQLPFLIWMDNCSKDQLDGYAFALGAVYDVVADDPSIPADKVATLVEDARAIGKRLMRKVELEPGKLLDLVIVDADGRPATHHDLSASIIAPGAIASMPVNGFNALMALGIIRTLFHVSGDEELGRFYYEELIGARNYLGVAESSVDLMYLAESTNYSNVNMAFVAVYGVLRYESDPRIARRARALLETKLYAPGKDRDAEGLGQSFFDFIYAAFRAQGSTGAGATALAQGLQSLREARGAPYWDVLVENCDQAEIDSRSCAGLDGTPITLASNAGRGGGVVATGPVPMRIRPPSNFEWRSDPHSVNGGGSDRLNPGGDFHAAYWMARYLKAGSDGAVNVSPRARSLSAEPPPEPEQPAGCGCQGGRAPGLLGLWLVSLAASALLSRRTGRGARRPAQIV